MIITKAHAKINWSLQICSLYPNGYHELDMHMQSISLYDELCFAPDDAIALTVVGADDLASPDNLVLRAAHMLAAHSGCTQGAHISLTKHIPSMAGLGGGSADCAATLIALNRMWSLNYSIETLCELGLKLGADVPFCLIGGLARVQGLGELIEPLTAPASPHLLMIHVAPGLSTKNVFQMYDRLTTPNPQPQDHAERALLCGDYATLNHHAHNALYEPACLLLPDVADAVHALMAHGASFARMSGSGSAVFGVFDREEDMLRAHRTLAAQYAFCQPIKTWPRGVDI